ncbi:dihydroxyacetone kinase subunit L [Nostoc sp. FACHB-87]|uniref:dihydroxyacetone kinase subunit DhaL n=1 Tax=Nostocaceae TaxID=1162 RepID=UPI001689665A|nr:MULTISPECIES: dihydroxyacetone kinase subunit DhaL [Nostocaceae]MBD2457931.1 dihydroxyacetone kinase subunit L [Nostoc sp. FACHB-87]MBD2479152.1 dihydroxyacetone kinase subunit L [Anabaena sp. FACHB-83]
MVTQAQILKWLQIFGTEIDQNKEYLTELDAAIGDADHGINMDRGFRKVISQLPTVTQQDIGSILKTVSMTLISSVGGASGPLYGTFFLKASTIAAGKQELTTQELLALLQAGLDGVLQRAKAQLEDKTMVDVLSPAVVAFRQAVEEGKNTVAALQKSVAVAEQALQNTKPMLAKKGRASYLGERSIGHQDPGATSSYLMLRSLMVSLEDGE